MDHIQNYVEENKTGQAQYQPGRKLVRWYLRMLRMTHRGVGAELLASFSELYVVRSTLLQVWGDGQIGWRVFLLLAFPVTL